ncbi:uncharacterized protein C2845_PM11G24630 [Panicum miliaceum]|uniref:Uncharacterized protein n=1 Tax=Panicum miliaceum TaxID=4540 RepID=A0A3L6RQ75_PANMI|nr:uncharacterized protein C2845_PM11G24630 [Panicum miliaceum]
MGGALLFGSVRDSISPLIDEAKAYDKPCRLESKFLHVRGVADVVSPPEDNPVGQDAHKAWKMSERELAGLPPEKGLSLLRKKEAD